MISGKVLIADRSSVKRHKKVPSLCYLSFLKILFSSILSSFTKATLHLAPTKHLSQASAITLVNCDGAFKGCEAVTSWGVCWSTLTNTTFSPYLIFDRISSKNGELALLQIAFLAKI